MATATRLESVAVTTVDRTKNKDLSHPDGSMITINEILLMIVYRLGRHSSIDPAQNWTLSGTRVIMPTMAVVAMCLTFVVLCLSCEAICPNCIVSVGSMIRHEPWWFRSACTIPTFRCSLRWPCWSSSCPLEVSLPLHDSNPWISRVSCSSTLAL